jgi:hypothetical protein
MAFTADRDKAALKLNFARAQHRQRQQAQLGHAAAAQLICSCAQAASLGNRVTLCTTLFSCICLVTGIHQGQG